MSYLTKLLSAALLKYHITLKVSVSYRKQVYRYTALDSCEHIPKYFQNTTALCNYCVMHNDYILFV